jgi:hypothetical protein
VPPHQGSRSALLTGQHVELGQVFAAVDPSARFVVPGIRPSRLGARLAPFESVDAGRHALERAGVATIEIAQ